MYKTNTLAPEALLRRIEGTLKIARLSIGHILIQKTELDLSVYEATPDKFIAETALLLRSVISLCDPIAEHVREKSFILAQTLAPHARSHRLALASLAHPGLALDYLAPHIIMSHAGFKDSQFDDFLDLACSSSLTSCRERVPHRALEQKWLSYLSGQEFPTDEDISATVLGKSLDVLFSSRDDIYAFTHALMYATDFGQKEASSLLNVEHLTALAEGALIGALESDDFDLAGELLMTWPFLRVDFSPIAAFCFEFLCHMEDQAGILPSFSLDKREYTSLKNDDEKSAYIMAAGYHTAYVMGLLCTALLRAKTSVQKKNDFLKNSLELPVLSYQAPKIPHWYIYFNTLNDIQKKSILRLIFDALIKKSALRLDMGGIRNALLLYSKLELSHGILQLQAAQLMQRMAQADF